MSGPERPLDAADRVRPHRCRRRVSEGQRLLILDRDPLYTAPFRQLLTDRGCRIARLPARSPNLNAFAERSVLSARFECLDRIVPLDEGHLPAALKDFIEHDHRERPHQGLGNRLIEQEAQAAVHTGSVRCRERLGGAQEGQEREQFASISSWYTTGP